MGGREEIPSIGDQERRREELPRDRGQGRWAGGATHTPTPEARDGGREEQPHAVAAGAQEGPEEQSHIEGQEGQR